MAFHAVQKLLYFMICFIFYELYGIFLIVHLNAEYERLTVIPLSAGTQVILH